MDVEQLVIEWAKEKGIYRKENIRNQALKMCSESGEVADAILKMDNTAIKEEIGDVIVTLVILSNVQGWSLNDCLETAYNKIKNRKGKTINGTFIKQQDND